MLLLLVEARKMTLMMWMTTRTPLMTKGATAAKAAVHLGVPMAQTALMAPTVLMALMALMVGKVVMVQEPSMTQKAPLREEVSAALTGWQYLAHWCSWPPLGWPCSSRVVFGGYRYHKCIRRQ